MENEVRFGFRFVLRGGRGGSLKVLECNDFSNMDGRHGFSLTFFVFLFFLSLRSRHGRVKLSVVLGRNKIV